MIKPSIEPSITYNVARNAPCPFAARPSANRRPRRGNPTLDRRSTAIALDETRFHHSRESRAAPIPGRDWRAASCDPRCIVQWPLPSDSVGRDFRRHGRKNPNRNQHGGRHGRTTRDERRSPRKSSFRPNCSAAGSLDFLRLDRQLGLHIRQQPRRQSTRARANREGRRNLRIVTNQSIAQSLRCRPYPTPRHNWEADRPAQRIQGPKRFGRNRLGCLNSTGPSTHNRRVAAAAN